MKSVDLQNEKASEPIEEAHQPSPETKMPPDGKNPKKLSFAENVDFSSSQRSSSYKDVLSQPPAEMSPSQKLLWLQKRRTTGLWAQCDECDRWRFLNGVLDRHELPKKWYCGMNADKEFASCSVPEAPLRLHDEEDLIHSEYAAGSLVWARLAGWPWWPAMVDDCPDTEQYYWLDGFSDIPTHYNVVFFDNMEVTRAWIAPEQLMPFSSNKDMLKRLKSKKYNSRLKASLAQANEAEKLPHDVRLARFSFVARHKGTIRSPKKIKRSDIEKYQKQFKRKFNIDFPLESTDSDEDIDVNTETKKSSKYNNNVIVLGTPKRAKGGKSRTPKNSERVLVTKNKEHAKNDIVVPNEPQNQNTGESVDKQTNSMAVQVGSTEAESIDNDTSATYVPENSTQRSGMELSVRIDTPSSDFDF